MKPESRYNGDMARQRLGKHIPVATNTQVTIKELLFLCNGEVNTPL
jgi:hypothetical protein